MAPGYVVIDRRRDADDVVVLNMKLPGAPQYGQIVSVMVCFDSSHVPARRMSWFDRRLHAHHRTLEHRDTERAERLVRQHSLDLAAHVDKYCDFLD